jgi:hypothetical protein
MTVYKTPRKAPASPGKPAKHTGKGRATLKLTADAKARVSKVAKVEPGVYAATDYRHPEHRTPLDDLDIEIPKSAATQRKAKSAAAANRILGGRVNIDPVDVDLRASATPLDVMVEAMRVAYRRGGAIAAFPFAKDCAPYMHARINSIELKPPGTDRPPITRIVREVMAPPDVDYQFLLGESVTERVREPFIDAEPADGRSDS